MAAPTILSSPLFMEAILPFLLVFTVVYAVLQKTGVLGKEKKHIDAMVAFVIGLITIAFGYATSMISNLIPFLSVSLIIILIFLVLWGFAFHGEEFKIPKKVTYAFGVIIGLALVVAVLVAADKWNTVVNFVMRGGAMSETVSSIVLVIVVVVAIAAVIGFGGKDEAKK